MALTPEELRQRIPSWSLESDGQLLQYMISIAKNLEAKCTKTRDNLNTLMLQVNQTELKLATATNQFSAVEQVKFVENRVEEDDESFYGLRRRRQQQQQQQQHQVAKESKQTKLEPDGERSFDDLIQLAVEQSIEGMYKSYEKVTLELTDSDTSDGEDGPDGSHRITGAELAGGKASIMRAVPRHPFIDRPLPHVIGTKEWQNKWHVGLIDSDDESGSDRKQDEYSESSSDTDLDGGMFPSQPNSKNHTPSESESSIWGTDGGRKRAPSIDPSITGDDGSSVYSYASSSRPRTLPTTLPSRMVAPLGATLKPPGLYPEEPPEEMGGGGKRKPEKGLFDESPEEDEEEGREHEQKSVPLPTPRQNVPSSEPTVPFFRGTMNQPARKMVNLFDDEPPSPQDSRRHAPEPRKTINLFIESEEEEEEERQVQENVRNNNVPTQGVVGQTARSQSTSNKIHSGPPTANPRTMSKLVDELNNNFRKATQPQAQAALFDQEPPVDDFEQLFSAANSATNVKPIQRNTPPTQQAVPPPEKRTVNLFADDDDEDDGIVVGSNERQPEPVRSPFISPIHQQVAHAVHNRGAVGMKSKSIFDESDSEDAEVGQNDGTGLFASLPKRDQLSGLVKSSPPASSVTDVAKAPSKQPKAIKSIFSDSSEAEDDDDDALFGRSSSIVRNKLDALKRNGTSGASVAAPPVSVHSAAPDEIGTSTKNTVGKAKSSLFDDDSDDEAGDSLFSEKTLIGKPNGPRVVVAAQKKEPAKVSLFDDDEEDGDDGDNRSLLTSRDLVPSVTTSGGDSNSSGEGQLAPRGKLSDNTPAIMVDRDTTATTPADGLPATMSVAGDPLKDSTGPADTNRRLPAATGPEATAGSIRSMIMKKSIFNSDSESEEDSSIFSPTTKPPPAESARKVQTDVADICDNEVSRSQQDLPKMVPREEAANPRSSGIVPVESISQLPTSKVEPESAVVPEEANTLGTRDSRSPVNNTTGDNHQSIANKSDIDQKADDPGTSPAETMETDKPMKTELPVQKSIFADSSSENEDDADLDTFVSVIKTGGLDCLDRASDDRAHSERSATIANVKWEEKQAELLSNATTVHPASTVANEDTDAAKATLKGSSQCTVPNGEAVIDEVAKTAPMQPLSEPMVDDDVELPGDDEPTSQSNQEERPPLGMIANDIDYFLRTNEPSRPVTPPVVKSEPKSALNFSPIGLFDDVPPPDDEADQDEQRKHGTSQLPPMDDTAAYPAESQSLPNFIPNGSAGGNGPTRYLFDDEPPPDDPADNGRIDFNAERYPFGGTGSKGAPFFDDRQHNLPDQPVSLPPMEPDTTKAQSRPKVNKLNTKIAINVAALLPGARRPPATTATATAVPNATTNASKIAAEDPSESIGSAQTVGTVADERTGGLDRLTSLNKGRARIPTKRKPPSRQTLRAAAVTADEGQQQKLIDSLDTDDQRRIVVGSEQKVLHFEGDPTDRSVELPFSGEQDGLKRPDRSKLDPLVDRLSASVRKPASVRVAARPEANEEPKVGPPRGVIENADAPPSPPPPTAPSKSTSNFGDSCDDSNDDDAHGGQLFGSKAPAKSAAGTSGKTSLTTTKNHNTRSLFGSDDEDNVDDEEADDLLFGGKQSSIAKHLRSLKLNDAAGGSSATSHPSVKPPSAKAAATSLFGDDNSGSDDSDDLFGGKTTKSFSKPGGTQNAPIRSMVATSAATKTATSTPTVNDPLADLLDS